MSAAEVPQAAAARDAGGCFVAPGFIDMHLHGGGGADVMDGTAEAFRTVARAHARLGSTAIVPTTLTSSMDDLLLAIDSFEEALASPTGGASLLGLHLEGPYLAESQRGIQDARYLKNPDPAEYHKILDRSPHIIRVSCAPELPGALEFGRELKRRGVLASIGHTDATYCQVAAAVAAGYSHVTHLYSGMSGVRRVNCYRVAGVIESALLMDELTVEVIADGRHLPASLLKLIFKCKGPDRMVLCTDAMRAATLEDGEYVIGSLRDGQKVSVRDGVAWGPNGSAFAGSVATTNRLVETVVTMGVATLEQAVRMVTSTPAAILGIDHRKGSLEPGKDADIVVFDDDFSVKMVIVEGEIVYAEDRRDGPR